MDREVFTLTTENTMTQQTDKYGNVIVDERFDVNGNRIYQKLRKIHGDILDEFYKYDANNKIVYRNGSYGDELYIKDLSEYLGKNDHVPVAIEEDLKK